MKAKVIFLMSLCLFFILSSSFATSKRIELRGLLEGNNSTRLRSSFDGLSPFISATLDESTMILDLEFFQSYTNTTIQVWGNCGSAPLFYQTVSTVNGTHVYIDLSQSSDWYFDIYINNSNGLDISGDFGI